MIEVTVTKQSRGLSRHELAAMKGMKELLIHTDKNHGFLINNLFNEQRKQTLSLDSTYDRTLLSDCLGFNVTRKHFPILKDQLRQLGVTLVQNRKHKQTKQQRYNEAVLQADHNHYIARGKGEKQL